MVGATADNAAPARAQDLLSAQEKRSLREKSDVQGALQVATTVGITALAFALFIIWPSWITGLLAAIILGGRAQAFGILAHDCAHNAVFRSQTLNRLTGHYLCSPFFLTPLEDYARSHMKHHRDAGTEGDPDIVFVTGYPTSRASMLRKVLRDISGINGVKLVGFALRNATWGKCWHWPLVHGVVLGLCWLAGNPLAYLLWWAGMLFVFPLMVRLRVMGEHGAVPSLTDDLDPRANTRTTRANWLERLLVAPNNVGWHVEHHAMPAVPSCNLRRLHELLVTRGWYQGHDCIANGYADVVRRCISDMRSEWRGGAGGRVLPEG